MPYTIVNPPAGDSSGKFTIVEPPQEGEDLATSMARTLNVATIGYASYAHPISAAWNIGNELLSLFGQGEALSGLEELSPERIAELRQKFPTAPWPKEGEEINTQKYLEAVAQSAESTPSFKNIAKWVEEKTGAPLTPKNKFQQVVDYVSSISGLKPGSLTQKGMAGLKGGSMSELMKGFGVPGWASDLMGYGYALQTKTPEIKVHTGESKTPVLDEYLKETFKEPPPPPPPPSGFGGIAREAELPQGIFGFKEGEEISKAIGPKIELSEADKILQKIKKESISIAESVEKGLPIKEQNNRVFEMLEQTAPLHEERLNPNPMYDFISEERARLMKAPTPSPDQEVALKKLNQIEFDLRRLPHESYSLEEALAQYRANNRARTALFEEKLVKGSQRELKSIYDGFNNAISKMILKDNKIPNNWKRMFGKSNQIHSKLSKLEDFENIYNQIAENGILDPKKFNSYFRDPKKGRFLKDAVGEEGYNKLKELNDNLFDYYRKTQMAKTTSPEQIEKAFTTRTGIRELKQNLTEQGKGTLFEKRAEQKIVELFKEGKYGAKKLTGEDIIKTIDKHHEVLNELMGEDTVKVLYDEAVVNYKNQLKEESLRKLAIGIAKDVGKAALGGSLVFKILGHVVK